MKNIIAISLLGIFLATTSCSTTKDTVSKKDLEQELTEKNRGNFTLLQRMRQLPGVTVRYGVPFFSKAYNSIQNNLPTEPLYVLNGYIVGNSFGSLNELVDSFNVKSIETLTGPDAAIYGSRAASGVILIDTYQ